MVPVAAPIDNVVAAFAKLTVVAVVLIRSNELLPVVKDVVIAGLVPNTNAPEPVSSEIIPANSLELVAAKTFNLSVVTTKVLLLGIVVLLMLVALATPSTGVTKVGLVANTNAPEPVSSEITPANSLELVAAKTLNLSVARAKLTAAPPPVGVTVSVPSVSLSCKPPRKIVLFDRYKSLNRFVELPKF